MRRGHSNRWRTALPVMCSVLGATLVCCSLFVDTDGLSGGASDASTFDSSVSDAPLSSDTSVDAGIFSDAPNGFDAQFPGCGAPHAACDDFETSSFTDRWNASNVYHSGILEYVNDASVSPTHALHSAVTMGGANSGAALYQNLVAPASTIHCQLQVLIRPSSPDPWEAFGLSFAGDDSGVEAYSVTLNVGSTVTQFANAASFADGGGPFNEQDLPALPIDTWTPIVVDMQPSGSSETVTLTIGNGTPHTIPFNAPPGLTLTQIEVSSDYSITPIDMLVDNVLCDVVP